MLTLDRRRWRYTGAEEQAIGELFSLYTTPYYRALNGLINPPESFAPK
jgi:hypothetical protein